MHPTPKDAADCVHCLGMCCTKRLIDRPWNRKPGHTSLEWKDRQTGQTNLGRKLGRDSMYGSVDRSSSPFCFHSGMKTATLADLRCCNEAGNDADRDLGRDHNIEWRWGGAVNRKGRWQTRSWGGAMIDGKGKYRPHTVTWVVIHWHTRIAMFCVVIESNVNLSVMRLQMNLFFTDNTEIKGRPHERKEICWVVKYLVKPFQICCESKQTTTVAETETICLHCETNKRQPLQKQKLFG